MTSKRSRQIALSPTLEVSALAGRLRAEGVSVLDFSAGQPDFPTPEPAKKAGAQAIHDDKTRYTANNGLVELREAVVENIRVRHGIDYDPGDVLVSPGAKASLYFACMALLDPGDEVLLPSPYWVSYPEQIRLCQAEPVVVKSREERGFKITPEELESSVTARTRMLVLNYPSNPTGACYGKAELEALAAFCLRHRLWVVADEIYSQLVFDDRSFTAIAGLGEEIRSRTVTIDGMSKTYAMTGWRVGYASGPREVIGAMARIQSHATSNATSISQWASIEALKTPDSELRARTAEFERRRDAIVARLRELPGVTCPMPEGSFYAFPNMSAYFGKQRPDGAAIEGAVDLARYLLESARVALVPGEGFGAPGHIRFSYAVSLDEVREGMTRIEQALAELR